MENAKTLKKTKKTANGKVKTYLSTVVKIKGLAKDQLFSHMRQFFHNGGDLNSVEFEIIISSNNKVTFKVLEI